MREGRDTHRSTFNNLCEHHNDRHVLLPNHLPMMIESTSQRALTGDVFSRLAQTLLCFVRKRCVGKYLCVVVELTLMKLALM